MADTQKPTKGAKVFSDEERSAMKERAKEQKADAKRANDADAERLHALIKATAPNLIPRTWYGQPAYAKDGKVVLFFQAAQKFKTRYATLGFSDEAYLDDGTMWPTSYALKELTAADEAKIGALVKKAVS